MSSNQNYINTKDCKYAPIISEGLAIGKSSMVYAYSNSMLEIAPFEKISDAARTFYLYMTTIILDDVQTSLRNGDYSFDSISKRFYFNIREYLSLTSAQGKKHYTFSEIREASKELVGQPLEFIRDNGQAYNTVAFFSQIDVNQETGDCYFDVATSLLGHYVPELSDKKEQHLLSIIEAFKFSNIYADALYRLINGHVQAMEHIKDYSVSITVLKRKMGLTPEQQNWSNKYFISRVLSKAVEAINNISDISMEYEIKKLNKRNQYSDVVFTNIKRKGVEYQDVIDAVVVENIAIVTNEPEIKQQEPVKQTNEDIAFNKASILAACLDSGLSIEQSIQISEKFMHDINRFNVLTDMFQTFLKYNIKTPKDRFDFFMKPEVASI